MPSSYFLRSSCVSSEDPEALQSSAAEMTPTDSAVDKTTPAKRKADSDAQDNRPSKTVRKSLDQTLIPITRKPEDGSESTSTHTVPLKGHPKLLDMMTTLHKEMEKQLVPQKDLDAQNKKLREEITKLRDENRKTSQAIKVLGQQKLELERDSKQSHEQMQHFRQGLDALIKISATALKEPQKDPGHNASETNSIVGLTCATAHVYILKDSQGRELTLSQEHKDLLLKTRAETYKYFAVLQESGDPKRHLEKNVRSALCCEQNRCIMIARALESLGRQETSVAQLNSQLQNIQLRFEENLERLGYSELPTV